MSLAHLADVFGGTEQIHIGARRQLTVPKVESNYLQNVSGDREETLSRHNHILRTPSVSASHPSSPWQGLSRRDGFFRNDSLDRLLGRATSYARAGVTVHLSGGAGLGKTTLAMKVAEELGRPISFMTGNQWLTTKDFVGREIGQTERTIVDKYVQSVRRTETESKAKWKSAILATAMLRGHVLVYDEFTRASPEANAALLSVLEEGVLVSTDGAHEKNYIEAHEDFRVILTSNPHDYVGVNSAPDALLDRVLTIHLQPPDIDQIAGILAARTGLDKKTARRISEVVTVADKATDVSGISALRSGLLISRIVAHKIRTSRLTEADIVETCFDVLNGRGICFSADDITAALSAHQNVRASAS